jgi:hypothetical protein
MVAIVARPGAPAKPVTRNMQGEGETHALVQAFRTPSGAVHNLVMPHGRTIPPYQVQPDAWYVVLGRRPADGYLPYIDASDAAPGKRPVRLVTSEESSELAAVAILRVSRPVTLSGDQRQAVLQALIDGLPGLPNEDVARTLEFYEHTPVLHRLGHEAAPLRTMAST